MKFKIILDESIEGDSSIERIKKRREFSKNPQNISENTRNFVPLYH